jgi:hypothetical protein
MSRDSIVANAKSMGYDAKEAHVMARQVENALRAVNDAMAILSRLRVILEDDDDDAKLIALRSLASTIGYSNSVGTAWAELSAAAGAIHAMLEAAP